MLILALLLQVVTIDKTPAEQSKSLKVRESQNLSWTSDNVIKFKPAEDLTAEFIHDTPKASSWWQDWDYRCAIIYQRRTKGRKAWIIDRELGVVYEYREGDPRPKWCGGR